jgi:hypothetical protein
MSANVTVRIPVWIDMMFVWPLLIYRRWKYGCTYRRIYLGEREWTILDLQDYYRFSGFKWVIHKNGKHFYAVRIAKIGNGRTKIIACTEILCRHLAGLLLTIKMAILSIIESQTFVPLLNHKML